MEAGAANSDSPKIINVDWTDFWQAGNPIRSKKVYVRIGIRTTQSHIPMNNLDTGNMVICLLNCIIARVEMGIKAAFICVNAKISSEFGAIIF